MAGNIRCIDKSLFAFATDLNIGYYSLKLTFQVIGAVAEFERDIISDRVKSGLENARAKGKKLGRPPLSPITISKIKALKEQGLSNRKIAKKLGVGEATVRQKTRA